MSHPVRIPCVGMSVAELEINDDHPLALELSSLKVAVTRFQREAHASSLKLQRHSLESTYALEKAQALQRENAALREELAALHAHPDTSPHPAELQVPEMTISLRKLSDKLTETEQTLFARTSELANALGDLNKLKQEVAGAYLLSSESRQKEESSKARERELARRVKAAEEDREMMDRVVQQYADLVRTLEGRKSRASGVSHAENGSTNAALEETLKDGKSGLHRLLEEFNAETEKLEQEIGRLHGELAILESKLEAQTRSAEDDRQRMAEAQTELDTHKADDSAATKMVSRYMKFSQSTTDTLQQSIDNLKARNAASTATLNLQIANLQKSLASERRQSGRLRDALDELTEQLARESYGRRREIALRLAVVGREDGLAEALRRWIRRAQETLQRTDHDAAQVQEAFEIIVDDAHQLLGIVDGDDEVVRNRGEKYAGLGSVARILAAEQAVKTLVEELQMETEKRMQLERVLGRAEVSENGDVIHPPIPVPAPKPNGGPVLAPMEPPHVDVGTSPIPPSSPITGNVKVDEGVSPKPPPSPEIQPALTSAEHPNLPEVPQVLAPSAILHQPTPRPAHNPQAVVSLHSSVAASPVSVPTPRVSFPTALAEPPLVVNEQALLDETDEPASSVPQVSPAVASIVTASRPDTPPPAQDPLLAELAKARTRYDTLQRAFRDCHLALRDLTQTIPTLASSPTLSVLQTAVSRLDDFNEDTRVELEIRIADEERIARGYETLLSIPGAIPSEAEAADVTAAVRAFVDGTDSSVARAQTQFSRKLDDLEHDVAAVKRALHELPVAPIDAEQPKANPNASWTSLAAGLFAPSSRPVSPAPTFGSVMTSPRLRRAPSHTQMQVHVRGPSTDAAGRASPSPFAVLDLRISMPEHVLQPPPSPGRLPSPRARTTSGMYMLGLGMRSASFAPRHVGSAGASPMKGRTVSMVSMQRPTVGQRVPEGAAVEAEDGESVRSGQVDAEDDVE
ncbi:hypothetical protein EVG20_g1436 [Dentipellis fragilis]|uniref:Uncharacterized protein n=1 Tax=Dentipellis fragilis TaxID=205917 RepID=A0A4Y9ZBN7_9AGAM|nr:hypothetical protein EVG20_g1436 [Dentipellis fragilis]